jgi:hypothetical protein
MRGDTSDILNPETTRENLELWYRYWSRNMYDAGYVDYDPIDPFKCDLENSNHVKNPLKTLQHSIILYSYRNWLRIPYRDKRRNVRTLAKPSVSSLFVDFLNAFLIGPLPLQKI